MSTMSDAEIIAWAKHVAYVYTNEPDLSLSTRYRRLAGLAEKGAEDWQPIATAPESTWDSERRGQRELLLSVDGSVRIGFREEGFSYVRNGEDSEKVDATHWRPLPAPPGGER